ncbi:hypothetical protein DF042_18250 [Burkholderia cenocepacia]|nr:hypothetical protein DF042_18250 [Burkholderia cenocepacia]
MSVGVVTGRHVPQPRGRHYQQSAFLRLSVVRGIVAWSQTGGRRTKYGGLLPSELRRQKRLEEESAKLTRLVRGRSVFRTGYL